MAWIVYRYIGRHVLVNILIALGVVIAIAGLIDLVEMFRRTASKDGVTVFITLQMAALRLPHLAEKLLPYSVLVGSMMALMKLTRSSELIVMRAAGVSVWRFLMPAMMIAVMIGGLGIAVINPLSAATLARYERMEARYINGVQQVLSVSSSGLWLKHVDTQSTIVDDMAVRSYIMQAQHIDQSDMTLSDVIIFLQNDDNGFIGRIDADTARLSEGYWKLANAVISIPGNIPQYQDRYVLPTELSVRQIQDSFAEPQTLSFWQLSGFIHTLEKAGFSALRHKLHWYSILISPFVFLAMVLLAAVFSLRMPRRGKMMLMVFGAVVSGFTLNFLTGLFHAFGYAGSLPVEVAVSAPYILAVMLSVVVLLHVEDG